MTINFHLTAPIKQVKSYLLPHLMQVRSYILKHSQVISLPYLLGKLGHPFYRNYQASQVIFSPSLLDNLGHLFHPAYQVSYIVSFTATIRQVTLLSLHRTNQTSLGHHFHPTYYASQIISFTQYIDTFVRKYCHVKKPIIINRSFSFKLTYTLPLALQDTLTNHFSSPRIPLTVFLFIKKPGSKKPGFCCTMARSTPVHVASNVIILDGLLSQSRCTYLYLLACFHCIKPWNLHQSHLFFSCRYYVE